MSTLKGPCKPTIADKPLVAQPPLLVNSTMTLACARGAITQRGMAMTKKPAKWRIKTTPSINGSREANTVLKRIEKQMTATVRSVPW